MITTRTPETNVMQLFLKPASVAAGTTLTLDIPEKATVAELVTISKAAMTAKLEALGYTSSLAMQCYLNTAVFVFAGHRLEHTSQKLLGEQNISKESVIFEILRLSPLREFAHRLLDVEKMLDDLERSLIFSPEGKKPSLTISQRESFFFIHHFLRTIKNFIINNEEQEEDINSAENNFFILKKASAQVTERFLKLSNQYPLRFNPTLIKYYDFYQYGTGVEGTCYNGQIEFVKPENTAKRLYPDEYLIAHILNKYIATKLFPKDIKIMTLVEPWKDNSGSRGGDKNEAINDLILQTIQKDQGTSTLLLVPFLYGYHHPGLVIDLKNQVAIYVDPFGRLPAYPETKNLEVALKGLHFEFKVITKELQTYALDETSCGPILTTCMMKCIDEYLAKGCMTTEGFDAKHLASERMNQMHINNTVICQDQLHIDEIMLADEGLWVAFLKEKQINNADFVKKVLECVRSQKTYIQGLEDNWEDNISAVRKVTFIQAFQAEVTQILKYPTSTNKSNIEELIDRSHAIIGSPPVSHSSMQELDENQQKLQIICYIKQNILATLMEEKRRLFLSYGTADSEDRIKTLNAIIKNVNTEIVRFRNNEISSQILKENITKNITENLDEKKLDKYKTWGKKLSILLLNILITIPIVTLGIKYVATKSCFFSFTGKSHEALVKARQYSKSLKI